MSTLTRIDLDRLRAYSKGVRPTITGQELHALIDAVEAARALTFTGYVPPPRLYAEVDALHKALERFA